MAKQPLVNEKENSNLLSRGYSWLFASVSIVAVIIVVSFILFPINGLLSKDVSVGIAYNQPTSSIAFFQPINANCSACDHTQMDCQKKGNVNKYCLFGSCVSCN